jgi:hypothetical protein
MNPDFPQQPPERWAAASGLKECAVRAVVAEWSEIVEVGVPFKDMAASDYSSNFLFSMFPSSLCLPPPYDSHADLLSRVSIISHSNLPPYTEIL